MTQYFVHDDLNLIVKVYYDDLNEAERNTNQYCRVQEVITRPVVLEAYQASVEKFSNFYRSLAS